MPLYSVNQKKFTTVNKYFSLYERAYAVDIVFCKAFSLDKNNNFQMLIIYNSFLCISLSSTTYQELVFYPGIYSFYKLTNEVNSIFFWLPNGYRFAKGTFLGYRTDTDFPGALF